MPLRRPLSLLVISFLIFAATGSAWAQDSGPNAPDADAGTSFTYQGDLNKGGSPVTATCDFQFSLFNAAGGGQQQGATQTVADVDVANGHFTVVLNAGGQFGARAFDGSARWLATSVKCPSDAGFTALNPRQALTAAPLAFALPGLRTEQNATSPNIIGGYISNTVTGGYVGATIGGGGDEGSPNRVTGDYTTVSGGVNNTASGDIASIGGGSTNTASSAATIAGGYSNVASSTYTTIGGGQYNLASGPLATVAGGAYGIASGAGSFVGGGGYDGTDFDGNTASGAASTVAGGINNLASGRGSFIGGGYNNLASGLGAVVGGGGLHGVFPTKGNQARGIASTIAGGFDNVVTTTANYGSVGGGVQNSVTYIGGTVSGGINNTAGDMATVGGGGDNKATQFAATVAGGLVNTASDNYATVAGGRNNTASGKGAFVGGGGNDGTTTAGNTASGAVSVVSGGLNNSALGRASTVAGGQDNYAGGDYSFAAGWGSNAIHYGAFVWTCAGCPTTLSSASNQFVVNAEGGFWFGGGGVTGPTADFSATNLISTTTGARLSIGGVWTNNSDRSAKTNFAPVDGVAVLNTLMDMPLSTWNYKVEDADVRHLGPMAQDFYSAFELGGSDTSIGTLDSEGVALAAIQGLYTVVQSKDAEISALQQSNAALTTRVAALENAPAVAIAAPAPATNTLQLLVVLVVGIAAGAGMCLGAFALGRKRA